MLAQRWYIQTVQQQMLWIAATAATGKPAYTVWEREGRAVAGTAIQLAAGTNHTV